MLPVIPDIMLLVIPDIMLPVIPDIMLLVIADIMLLVISFLVAATRSIRAHNFQDYIFGASKVWLIDEA